MKNVDEQRVHIPLMDMVAQYRSIQPEIDVAIRQVLEKGQFILGPNVSSLEREIAAYLGVEHGVGVGSGTDALVLALRALGIGPGDEVILPSYTFFATAEAVLLVGAKPVLVDIKADTYCIDVSQIEGRINSRTRAIIPVHLYGHPCDMSPLLEIARKHGLKVIEDNAQAFGAEYKGRKTGSMGDVGCLSFFPSKNLGGYGDGGMVVTNDAEVAQRVKMLRTHGWKKKYFPEMIGYNSRLDELQAAVLGVKLKHIDEWNTRRHELATQLNELLRDVDLVVPVEAPGVRHVYHLYMVRVADRDRIQQELKELGIPTAIYYPQALHETEPLQEFRDGSFPVSEQASHETLALPFFPEMSSVQVESVVEAVKQAVGERAVV